MYTEKMTKQNQQMTDYEYEITLLRRQLDSLETEHEKDQKKIADLEELLAKAREVRTCSFSGPASECSLVRVSRKMPPDKMSLLQYASRTNAPGKIATMTKCQKRVNME